MRQADGEAGETAEGIYSSAGRSESKTPTAADFQSLWGSDARYYKYSRFLTQRFGRRIWRVTVDGGFTCPNVDGTVAVGGCVYCDNRSFSPARRGPRLPILEQTERGIRFLQSYRMSGRPDPRVLGAPAEFEQNEPPAYLAYFQAGTNTYASVAELRQLYDEALSHPRVIGLVIGTRPDCAGNEVLDLLESYSERFFVAVEYGLQSIHARSLRWMNRGHDADCFFDAVERTGGRGIDISAHVILGLPEESAEDMYATADALVGSGVDGVKIHNLYVVSGTPLEAQYRQGAVEILDADAYLEVLIGFLERLPAKMVIHRVTGDAPDDYLVAPAWTRRKAEFLHRVDAEMRRRDTWQGKKTSTPHVPRSAIVAADKGEGSRQ